MGRIVCGAASCSRIFLALLVLITFSAHTVFGQTCAGDFSLSCSNIQLQGTSSLQALCGDGQGGFVTTSLGLDAHITNNNGNLQCSSSGDFSASCQSISLANSILSADCFDISGNLVQTSVDLDQCVQNSSGQLTWDCV